MNQMIYKNFSPLALIIVFFCILIPWLWINHSDHEITRRRLQYLRNGVGNKNVLDTKALSYGADIVHDSQHAIPPIDPVTESYSKENFTVIGKLKNDYDPKVFPRLRNLESHILNDAAAVNEFRIFKQENLIQLFKAALRDGELTECPHYLQENLFYGSNIYEAVETAITTYHPIYFLEFSTANGLASVTNYIAYKLPGLISLHVQFAREEGGNIDSLHRDCKPSFSKHTFLMSGEDYNPRDFVTIPGSKVDQHLSDKCIQYLESYTLIAQNLLPFEFETELGYFLCHCQVSYVPSSFPVNDPFYSHWDSPQVLIKNAINAASTCFQEKEIVAKAQTESYVMPVRNGFEVIVMTSKDTNTDQPPDSPFNETLSLEEMEELSHDFPWEWLQQLPLDYNSRMKLSRKILYDQVFTFNETEPLNHSRKSENQSSLLRIDAVAETKTSDESATKLSFDSQQPMTINQSSDAMEPGKLELQSLNQTTLDDDLQSESALNLTRRNTNASMAAAAAPVRRKLWPFSSVSNSNKYISNTKSSTGTTTSTKDDVDILETNELNFAWKLLDESQQILDLKEEQPSMMKEEGEIHDLMVKYYYEIINEEKLRVGEEFISPSYHLTPKTRQLQKLIYQNEKPVYQKWKDFFTFENSLYLSEIRHQFWQDLSQSRSLYFLGERLSLTSLKLMSHLTTTSTGKPNKLSSRKNFHRIQRNYPFNPNFLASSFFMDVKTAKTHYQLAKLMNIHNNLVFHPKWEMSLLYAWIGSTERGDVSIIESDTIITIISMVYEYSVQSAGEMEWKEEEQCSIDLVYEALSILLSLSSVTYVHLPTMPELLKAIETVTPNCYSFYVQEKLIPSTASSIIDSRSPNYSIDLTTTAYEEFLRQIMSKLLFSMDITIEPILPFSQEKIVIKDYFFRIELQKRSSAVGGSDLPANFESKTSQNGISLYSISHWNLLASQKKKVLQLLINLPLWNLKEYFFHHRADYNNNNHNMGSDRFHTNYEHDQHINLYQLAPWNIYVTIESSQSWQLSIITLHTMADGSINSKTLISITSAILENQKQRKSSSSFSSSSASAAPITNNFQKNQLQQEIQSSQKIYEILQLEFHDHSSELANGFFSFLEHSSGIGYVSSRLAKQYPNATIFSINHQSSQSKLHYAISKRLQIENNAICLQENVADTLIYQKLYDCPELFRFQLLFPSLLDQFIHKHHDLETWGETIGTILSSALTSFVYVPNPALVSYGLYVLFGMTFLYRDSKTNLIYSPTDLLQWRQLKQEAKTQDGSQRADEGIPIWKQLEPIYIEKQTSYRYLDEVIMTPNHHHLSEDINQLPPHHDHQPLTHLQEYFNKVMYLSAHPLLPYKNFQSEWLLSSARAKKGSTSLLISPLVINDQSRTASTRRGGMITQPIFFDFPMIRCDIVNMTRHVHHHYDYAKDGHSRTYTMHIEVNKTESMRVKTIILDPSSAISRVNQQGVTLSLPPSVLNTGEDHEMISSTSNVTLALGHHPSQHNIVSVRLFRDKDDFPIPYVSIYGVTLITALRLGLLPEIRERLFHSFLKLPLYEDMAPWNIVLMGSNVDYIDYDTREFTFDTVIPKAYQVMTVLMNYKRTVEDFKKCSGKANTVYGLPYVADCVGGYVHEKRLECSSDLRYPVPCSDGKCHSDYISCLRALSDIAQGIAANDQIEMDKEPDPIVAQMASSMSSVVAKFNPSSYKEINYEDFLNQLNN